jgi:ATP-dependent helicase/nuclease subunit B
MRSLRLVSYGPEAAAALRDTVATAKAGDPLAPVTVAVPSNYAGLSLRRRLGAGALVLNGRAGLVNVRFYVLARVAELLGAPTLAAQRRRPLTSAVRAEAVRAALEGGAGVFADVAEHPATERSLDSTFRDLRRGSDASLNAVAARSRRAADVVRLYRRFRELTAPYYDEEDLALAAAGAARSGAAALRDVGHVVLYLPRRLTPAEQTLIEALGEAGALSAIVGLTGDGEADALARRLASQLERVLGPVMEQQADEPPVGTHVVAVTDAEEEVREVLRIAMERLEQGTPLHRMAVLYPLVQPYALLAHEQFHAAGVPHNGPSVRTLAQTLAGRALLGLLRLRDDDFRRDEVMDWLSAAPVLGEDKRQVPSHRWDLISRSAGVVKGADQWRHRLGRHLRSLEQQRRALEQMDEEDESKLRRFDNDIGHVEHLARFIEELVQRARPRSHTSWEEFAAWGRGLLDRYLGGEAHGASWPEEEIDARRAVDQALDALSTLGEVRQRIDEQTFIRALERELEAPAERVGRFGDGVFIGRIADATGADFDLVFVVGMSEGVLPSRSRDDPLLPDRERAAADGLPMRAQRHVEERRDYLAALASARERILIYPRADLRGQRGKLPARWVLEAASRLERRRVFSAELETLPARPWFSAVASFEAALREGGEPSSGQEYDLRSMLRWQNNGRRATDHYLVRATAELVAGISAEIDRAGVALTRWDGRVAADPALAPSDKQPVSPTALQNWAACPFRYFLSKLLHVAETEKPEDTLTLTPLERGNLIHNALERFVRDAATRSSPDDPWTEAERAQLIAVGEQLCGDAELAGLTGRPILWRLERERILRDLGSFLDHDEELRAKYGVVPVDVEMSFGMEDGDPAVEFSAGGRKLAFRGRIDRVDAAPDGSKIVVLDYKSGSTYAYRELQKDAVQRGTSLQLPVYALAARAKLGDKPVDAYYWFVTERQNYETKGYPVDARRLDRFAEVLQTIVGGIEGGLFPARPGKANQGSYENCQFCPYDRVCPNDRARTWLRKQRVPEVRAYLDMAEPVDAP